MSIPNWTQSTSAEKKICPHPTLSRRARDFFLLSHPGKGMFYFLLPPGEGCFTSFSIDQRARAPQCSPRPPGEGAPERGAGAPILGDATVAAHISTRAIAALHPAPGSHPSTIRLEPAPPSAGAGVRGQRFCVVREKERG